MSSSEFGWESLLYSEAPKECHLKAAVFTTYDRADDRLLAEHLLPMLLKVGAQPDGEGVERQRFLLELDKRLKQMHDHLTVVSSTMREEPADGDESESGAYDWIWHSIRHLTVGRNRKAVQHAKLWFLHWGASDFEGSEYVEIVVSSANLTRSAFRGQLQGAWRVCLPLNPRGSKTRLAGWGVLSPFLRELGVSVGDNERFAPFLELLERADCPKGVTFVASVPGSHTRADLQRTPWGAAGLRNIVPPGRGSVSVAMTSPFVGSWNELALKKWCARFSGSADRIDLVWIDKKHPWATRWLLPESSLKALTDTGAHVKQLRHEGDDIDNCDVFHEEHRPVDPRWSHAKVYEFRRGTSRRILVTSANFSTSAWGAEGTDKTLTIKNFELGVCVEQAVWPFEDLRDFGDEKSIATVAMLSPPGSSPIRWAHASWNGSEVRVQCRLTGEGELKGRIFNSFKSIRVTEWDTGSDRRICSANVPWTDSKRPPSSIYLTCGGESMRVTIFDERPLRRREDTVPPEVNEDVVQAMRDELLFEQFGGSVRAGVDDDESTEDDDGAATTPLPKPKITNSSNEKDEDDNAQQKGHKDSFAVPAFDLARQHFEIVDNWADQAKRVGVSGKTTFERTVLRRDGELLVLAFQRQAERDKRKGAENAVGAKLAAEELVVRLKHFREA